MASNATVIEDAILCNQINKKSLNIANKGKIINRGVMLSNYTKETIDDCWESLTVNVIQNYQKGKGTVIKGFGTFTYKRQFINLEGTTNEYFRDKRDDEPVFIVSKDLNKDCMSGEYTHLNTIKCYNQKENKSIPLIPLNYSEIAYRLSMSKDEVENIISNLIKSIGDSISQGTFKNKIFPNLGILFCKYKIIAFKFNDEFILKIRNKNRKLNQAKKGISLNTDISFYKNLTSRNLSKSYNYLNKTDLKAENSLNTKLDNSFCDYLKTKYDIDINKIPKHHIRNIYNSYDKNDGSFNFINDYSPINTRNRKKNEVMNSPLFTLDLDTLNSFEYYKGVLVLNSKKYDINKYGNIIKEEMIKALINSNISDKIDENLAKNIVEYYNKTDKIEYMKFIAQMIKDIQEYFYLKNSEGDLNISVNDLKNNLINKKILSKKMNKSCFNGFYPKRKLNISKKLMNNDIDKVKLLPNIKGRNSNFETNLRYIQEETKNDDISNNDSLEINHENDIDIFGNYKDIDAIKSMISNIKLIIPELKQKYLTTLSQNISSYEFLNILKKYEISYLKKDLDNLLIFLGIKDINAFSLEEFFFFVNNCKVIETKMRVKDLNLIIDKLKDIIFINGGVNFLFKNCKNLNCDNFIKIIKEKSEYDSAILKDIFYYMVKSDREFTLDDYFKFFEYDKKILDDPYYVSKMKLIINEMNNKHLTHDEYFNHLLSYNISTKDKFITRINWINYLQKEKINLSAKDCDNLFLWIDTKKDNLIDINEFISKVNFTTKPLTVFKDIILNNKLDIEDLAHKMNMSIDEIKQLTFDEFKNKIQKIDYTLSEDFIRSIFQEISSDAGVGGGMENFLEQNKFLKEIDYKKAEFYEKNKNKYFIQKYRETILKKIKYEDLKKLFEKRDEGSFGALSKTDYASVLSKIIPEFNDKEHMVYVRVNDALDKNGEKIIYSKILNSIYYYIPEKQDDNFIKLCQILSQVLKDKCNDDIEKLIFYISEGIQKKSSSLNTLKPLTLEKISNFLKDKYNENIPDKIILKLDIDSDGLISFEDIKSVLKRFVVTDFFKYNNEASNPRINLYSSEVLPDDKIRSIIKNLYNYMNLKNISETGLFKKLDKNCDGFISNVEFNEEIDKIIKLSPTIKDQFFNFLDFYHNGMIDLSTFISRLTNMDNDFNFNFLSQNNNLIENQILQEFKNFCIKYKNYSDTEIYELLDKDCDGVINMNDFQNFVTRILLIPKEEFTKENLERVMMSISLSKNLQIGINDIREFINISNEQKHHMNLKQVFKITSNQNLSELKSNKEWINDIIERLGMYISEKFESIEQFFEKYSKPGSGKFKFEDFLKFQEENLDCFNNGFNLSKDEIMALFASLDSHKKNYLTKQDLENKLQIFNFYNKMHIDIKNFFQQNFTNGIDAFKFFIKTKNQENNEEIEEEKIHKNDINSKCSINLKDFFETFENFFPKKYATNTILKYLNKYFKITIPGENSSFSERKDKIYFDEFNYAYFDKLEENKKFIERRCNKTKLFTNRFTVSNEVNKNLLRRSSSTITINNSNFIKKKKIFNVNNLSTPFDLDPLNKIRRIIFSSQYNLTKFFENIALKAENNSFMNKYKFKNMIKEFKIGLTNKEIDFIISKCGSTSYNNKINFRDFMKYLKGQEHLLKEGNNNIALFIGEIKSLIYKYYSNPIICFQNNDVDHSGQIDFEKYKNLIFDMYTRNRQEIPNFILIKNSYDALDLRKDGIIDIKEWCIAFASYNSKLDYDNDKIQNGPEFFNNKKSNNVLDINNSLDKSMEHNRIILREWETSGDVVDIYLFIHKNRKIIKNKIYQSDYSFISKNKNFIHSDNLIKIIRDIMPNVTLSQMQWKMIVNIAINENFNNLIDIDKFFRIVEITAKNMMSQPKIFNSNYENKLMRTVSDSYLFDKNKSKNIIKLRNSHINRLKKFNCATNLYKPKVNFVNMVNFKNVVLPGENKKKK